MALKFKWNRVTNFLGPSTLIILKRFPWYQWSPWSLDRYAWNLHQMIGYCHENNHTRVTLLDSPSDFGTNFCVSAWFVHSLNKVLIHHHPQAGSQEISKTWATVARLSRKWFWVASHVMTQFWWPAWRHLLGRVSFVLSHDVRHTTTWRHPCNCSVTSRDWCSHVIGAPGNCVKVIWGSNRFQECSQI